MKHPVLVVPDDEPVWRIVISKVNFHEPFQPRVRLTPSRLIDIQVHNVRIFRVAPARKGTEVFVALRVIDDRLRKEAQNLNVDGGGAVIRVFCVFRGSS